LQSGLLNLVVNARDAMPDGGNITIQTRNITLDQSHANALSGIEPGPYVLVAVYDNGQGMSPEVRARAIEPFYTTKAVGKGSGLGLSQVYGFVRQSKGQMEIQSDVGRGTTLRLYFPRSLSMATAKTPEPPAADIPDDKNAENHLSAERPQLGSILVVEDDPLVLTITAGTVRSLGYEVYTAANAQQALKLLEKGMPIDVLLTDVIMPDGINGLELAQNVAKLRPQIHVLMVSGYSRELLAAKEGITGMRLMSKPYEISDLAQALADVMA
jgi:CheY-like chemotaxis protein